MAPLALQAGLGPAGAAAAAAPRFTRYSHTPRPMAANKAAPPAAAMPYTAPAGSAAGAAAAAACAPAPPSGRMVGRGVVSGESVAEGEGVEVGVTEGVAPSEGLCEEVAVTEGVTVELAEGPKKADSVLSPVQFVCPRLALHTMMVQQGAALQGTPGSWKTGEVVMVE